VPDPITTAELEAYLDEALPTERMARIEEALRRSPDLARRMAAINARRDAGIHTLGDIWRRHRLTCLTREQLGSYLLGVLPEEWERYVHFHLEQMGCRYCQANLCDLESQEQEQPDMAEDRRRRYFQSSAGYLRPGRPGGAHGG
jgi:hypothetical protein